MVFELLAYCPYTEADYWEAYYIRKYKSFFPDGYNLTSGGRRPKEVVAKNDKAKIKPQEPQAQVPKREHGETNHTDETKVKIGEGIKAYFASEHGAAARVQRTANVREQHLAKKYAVGMAFPIDPNNIESYLAMRKSAVAVIFERKAKGKAVDFHCGKEETMDACRQRAIDFLKELVCRQQNQLEKVKN